MCIDFAYFHIYSIIRAATEPLLHRDMAHIMCIPFKEFLISSVLHYVSSLLKHISAHFPHSWFNSKRAKERESMRECDDKNGMESGKKSAGERKM